MRLRLQFFSAFSPAAPAREDSGELSLCAFVCAALAAPPLCAPQTLGRKEGGSVHKYISTEYIAVTKIGRMWLTN